jgi:predicted DNA-binding protein
MYVDPHGRETVAASKPVAAPSADKHKSRRAVPGCRLVIYMAAADTTTIRVSTQTRDRLKVLAVRRGESASDVVAKLVSAADEEAMLAEVEAGFEKLAGNSDALAAYRAESREIETAFDAPTAEW